MQKRSGFGQTDLQADLNNLHLCREQGRDTSASYILMLFYRRRQKIYCSLTFVVYRGTFVVLHRLKALGTRNAAK